MKPLAELPGVGTRALLFDIDDTLTTEGKLTAEAYAALERLHRTGMLAVAVTGRPAGGRDHIARVWPVDGVVGGNGRASCGGKGKVSGGAGPIKKKKRTQGGDA